MNPQFANISTAVARKEQIISEHKKTIEREKRYPPNRPLAEILEDVLDDEEDQTGCLVCHL